MLAALVRDGTRDHHNGPQNHYVNRSHGNNSCNCNCKLAAKFIPKAIPYVIVIDAFLPWETESHTKIILSRIGSVIVLVTGEKKRSQNAFYVCNVYVDDVTKLQNLLNIDLSGQTQAVFNGRFAKSQLNSERCWHICERSPSRYDHSSL